jgi:hypothetical protein
MGRGKIGRRALIDELSEQFGYNRKHAIKLLRARTGRRGNPEVSKGWPRVEGR